VLKVQNTRSSISLSNSFSYNITQAFVAAPFSGRLTVASSTGLDMASRINAKTEKRKRNRENMRKFKKGGRRGTSKKKMMRKVLSSAARQVGY
jgi:hypothetical protein